jgi:tRNA(Ile)-lysidine synthetase-like protein
MPLQTKVFNNLDQLLPPGTKTIVVAVSGGADSMALTLLANEYANENGYTLKAVTVDHNLRPESAEEALWVQQTLQGQGICHQTLLWHHDEDLNRRHERARAARYQLMLDFCKNHPNSVLLTAHHQQDQVETILMRFLHGSGPAGFQGIQRLRFQAGIPIVRPLLNVSPQELRAYLKNKAITWVEDPSNVNAAYERTRVRQLLEGITHDWGIDGILASAAKVYDAQSTMDEIVDGYAESFVISDVDVEVDLRLRRDDTENLISPRHTVIPSSSLVIPAPPFVIPAQAGIHPSQSSSLLPPLLSPLPPLSFPRRRESILDEVTVNQTTFFKCPKQIQRQWLRKQIWQIGGAAYPKPYKTIDAILKILKQPKVNGYKVAGCVINVSKRRLHLKGQ